MLEDRSYMRADPHRPRWSATVILMVVVIACFALQQIADTYVKGGGRWISDHLALSTGGLKRWELWQLITFQFLHVGLLHIICNLLGLWFFGRFVEERLGTTTFLKLYFLSGVAGGVLQSGLGGLFPGYFGTYSTYGASAGVCGLFAAFALMEPHAEVRVMGVIPVKAKHLLWVSGGIAGFFTLVPSDSGYAHAAHLGGFLAAIGFMRWDSARIPLRWNLLQGRQRKRQLVQTAAQFSRWRSPRDANTPELPPGEFISREVDPILDKISAHGIHSLTPEERKVLEAARAKMAKR